MGTLLHDIRYASRTLVKNLGFTAIVVFVLALGLGACSTIFSIVNAVLLRPLPYEDAERLVMVWGSNIEKGTTQSTLTFSEYSNLREQNTVFEHLACYTYWPGAITGGDHPESIFALYATADLLPMLGASPLCGRTFSPDEDRPGAAPVIVLSYRLWNRRFGSDAGIIGTTVRFEGEPYTVTGVMPADFRFPPLMTYAGRTLWQVDAWIPLTPAAQDNGFGQSLFSVGRLKKGVSRDQAQAQMTVAATRFEASSGGRSVELVPMHEQIVGSTRPAIMALLGIVGFVLLLVCANVANLVLSRFTTRKRDFALRSALGASRIRILRQLMIECILLALLGGVVGGILSVWGVRAAVAFGPRDIPRLDHALVDARTMGFVLLLSVASGTAFGLVPALRAYQINMHRELQTGAARTTMSRADGYLHCGLVVAELALALILVTSAGLMARSFWNLQRVDLGFETRHRLTSRIQLPANEYRRGEEVRNFFSRVVEEVGSLPGVQGAGAVSMLPMSEMSISSQFTVDRSSTADEKPAEFVSVTPNYFRAIGIELLAGRAFSEMDNEQASPVVMISKSLAQQHWPGEIPIGRRLSCSSFAGVFRGQSEEAPVSREIVGVVSDVRHFGLKRPMAGHVYLPHRQDPWPWMTVVVKTAGDPEDVLRHLREEISSVDPTVPVSNMQTIEEMLSEEMRTDRFLTLLLATFASLAIVIASLGVYGIVSYSTRARTHEIGIRMALGATGGNVLLRVLREGLRLTLVGVAIGFVGALLLTRTVSTFLYGTTTTDPITFVCTSAILVGVALLACYIPARRAAHTDPMAALRE